MESLDPDFRLDGKVAVVTGASSGIGERAARLFAAHGAKVTAAARRADRLHALASDTADIRAVQCDVSDDDQVASMIDQTVDEFGRVDIVLNNAGITDAVTPAEHQDPSRFRQVVEVNLNASFVVASLAARQMIVQEDGGSIINMSSIHGIVASSPNAQAGYAASKGALLNLTRELAAQWATHRIRVNALAPGYFETELTAAMFESEDSGLRFIRRNTMLGRPGELHELDGPLLLLASAAGSYITGQTLTVDGGWTAR